MLKRLDAKLERHITRTHILPYEVSTLYIYTHILKFSILANL